MSSNYVIDVERRLVFKSHFGPIAERDAEATLDAVISDPTYRKGMDFCCDYSRASIHWTADEVATFRRYVSKLKLQTGRCRWAVLFAPGADTSAANSFMALHEMFSDTIEVRIFTDRDDALAWLSHATPDDTTRIEVDSSSRQ